VIVNCELKGFFFSISFDIENFVKQSFPKKIENLEKITIKNEISPNFSLFFGGQIKQQNFSQKITDCATKQGTLNKYLF